ncbi:zf-HC2 domain-containing protein [Salisaeta longa]|uniref:zf-HC2 domain-containing protein n=1 Tax=Salisaeta longa TaxID=503170 RepID=UPI0003B3884B|nr:zf-HC2 domain-containing protein [Salisaeta longa]
MDARVEAYVDDELSDAERARFEAIAAHDSTWRREIQQARQIRSALHHTDLPSCPPAVTEAVLERTVRRHEAPAPMVWWRKTLQRLTHATRALVAARRQPVVDYAVGLALVAVAAFFIFNPITPASTSQTTQSSNTWSWILPGAPSGDAPAAAVQANTQAQQAVRLVMERTTAASGDSLSRLLREASTHPAPPSDTTHP